MIRIIKVRVNISKKVPRGIVMISVLDVGRKGIGQRHVGHQNTCVKDYTLHQTHHTIHTKYIL
jgi:hypothetical protein